MSIGPKNDGRCDPVACLPAEVATYACSLVDATTLKAASLVSRAWRCVFKDESVGKAVYCRSTIHRVPNGLQPPHISPLCKTWFELCIKAARGASISSETHIPHEVARVVGLKSGRVVLIEGRSVLIWDPLTRGAPQEVLQVPGHISSVALIDGGGQERERFVLESFFEGAYIVDSSLGESRKVGGNSEGVFGISGGRLAVTLVDGVIEIYNADDGALLGTLTGHTDEILDVTELTSGEFTLGQIASASKDSTVKVWDLSSMTEAMKLQGHGEAVTSVSQLQNGDLLTGSKDGMVKTWNLEEGVERTSLACGHEVEFCFQLKNGSILTQRSGGDVACWKDDGACSDLGFSGMKPLELDDGRIVTTRIAGQVQVWDPLTASVSYVLPCQRPGKGVTNPISAAQLGDGRLLTLHQEPQAVSGEGKFTKLIIWSLLKRGAATEQEVPASPVRGERPTALPPVSPPRRRFGRPVPMLSFDTGDSGSEWSE